MRRMGTKSERKYQSHQRSQSQGGNYNKRKGNQKGNTKKMQRS